MPREARYKKEDITHLREKNLSWQQIADHYQVAKPSVWKWYQKQLSPMQTVRAQQASQFTTSQTIQAELIDTRDWSWHKWTLYFLGLELEPFQENTLEQLDSRLRVVINIPRRHGKTTIILRVFVLRKLCEMVLEQQDVNIIYVSSSKDNTVDFSLMLANDLINNDRVLENYGLILDTGTQKEMKKLQYQKMKRTTIKQTQFVLDIVNRQDTFNHTLQVNTIKSAIRGKGAHYVLIDDPVDIFATNSPDSKRKLTKKIMNYIKTKIYPIAIRNISVVGTRYDVEGFDIFTQLSQEKKGKVWRHISHKAVQIFGDYTVKESIYEEIPSDIIITDPGQWELLSHKIWDLRAEELQDDCTGLQLVVYYYDTMEDHWFKQEWQNEPIELGAHIDWNWLKWYEGHPISTHGKYVIFVDIATSESKEEESYTSMACVGREFSTTHYYLHDLRVGKWPALSKYREIADFARKMQQELEFHIPLRIEVVRNQAEAFQALRDGYPDLSVRGANPKGRGDKEWRIKEGLVLEMNRGNIYVNKNISHYSQFKSECETFPHLHPEILDAVDQAVFHLKVGDRDESFTSGKTSSSFRKKK